VWSSLADTAQYGAEIGPAFPITITSRGHVPPTATPRNQHVSSAGRCA